MEIYCFLSQNFSFSLVQHSYHVYENCLLLGVGMKYLHKGMTAVASCHNLQKVCFK